MVKNLVSIGKTVWLTTHFMDEAQYLADRVAVLAKGSIVAEGTPDSIAGRDRMRTTVRFRPPADAPTPPAWGQVPTGDGGFVIEAEDATRVVHEVTGWAIEHDVVARDARGDAAVAGGRLSGADRRGGAGMSQVVRQIRFTNKAFWRNPASAFFTFAFPLLFLVIFTTLIGNDDVDLGGGLTGKSSTFYVFSMAAFGLISACYTNIAISIVFAREEGVLKRVRGTPMPAGTYLTARVIHAALVGFLLVAITVVFGVVVYQAHFPSGLDVVYFVISLVVGAGCFAAIGLAISGLVPNADAGPPIINAVILPLLFLSGVFILIPADAPAWVLWVGRIFPVRHLVLAMQYSYLGLPFHWSDVAVMLAWMVGALFVARRTFRWEPRR